MRDTLIEGSKARFWMQDSRQDNDDPVALAHFILRRPLQTIGKRNGEHVYVQSGRAYRTWEALGAEEYVPLAALLKDRQTVEAAAIHLEFSEADENLVDELRDVLSRRIDGELEDIINAIRNRIRMGEVSPGHMAPDTIFEYFGVEED